MAFLGRLMEQISDAIQNPAKLPAALMSSGVILSAAALSLIIFKAPGGVFLRLHGSAPRFVYYGILIPVVVFGLVEASFGFWVVPQDPISWLATSKTLLWIFLLLIVLVAALGGLAFLK